VRADHVLVNSLGVVTLIDFGYAAAAGFPWPRSMISPVRRMKVRYCYLSPEQARGAVIDHRSDVFSAAGLISELVANVHPLPTATNDMETLRLVVQHDQLVSLDLPPALAQPLQRALLRERDLRPRAQELRDALVDGAKRIRLDIGPHVIAQRLVELGVPT
jgi:serine/threonine-protein kinase